MFILVEGFKIVQNGQELLNSQTLRDLSKLVELLIFSYKGEEVCKWILDG